MCVCVCLSIFKFRRVITRRHANHSSEGLYVHPLILTCPPFNPSSAAPSLHARLTFILRPNFFHDLSLSLFLSLCLGCRPIFLSPICHECLIASQATLSTDLPLESFHFSRTFLKNHPRPLSSPFFSFFFSSFCFTYRRLCRRLNRGFREMRLGIMIIPGGIL